MLRLIPVMAEAMAITTVTPMATPSIVSAARTLLDRTESSAMPTPSTMRLSTVIGRAGVTRPSARRSGRAGRPGWRGRPRPRCRRRRRAPRPTTTDQGATAAGSGVSALTTKASARPKPMPSSAPAAESVADSTTNCARMSRRRAPSAFRMPISRVRSLTAISMMFMITMPPTTSEMATRPGSARNRIREIFSQVPSAPSAVWKAKLFSCHGLRPRAAAHDRLGLAHGALHVGRGRRCARSARRGC